MGENRSKVFDWHCKKVEGRGKYIALCIVISLLLGIFYVEGVALSKHVTYYGPRPGVSYYNLATP